MANPPKDDLPSWSDNREARLQTQQDIQTDEVEAQCRGPHGRENGERPRPAEQAAHLEHQSSGGDQWIERVERHGRSEYLSQRRSRVDRPIVWPA